MMNESAFKRSFLLNENDGMEIWYGNKRMEDFL